MFLWSNYDEKELSWRCVQLLESMLCRNQQSQFFKLSEGGGNCCDILGGGFWWISCWFWDLVVVVVVVVPEVKVCRN
jgi:hypothetical protein